MTIVTRFQRFTGWLAVGLSSGLLAVPAAAESGNISAFAAGRSALATANCVQARDVTRCLAMKEARQYCQGKKGSVKRRCLLENMPVPDCGKAPEPRRCQALQQARLTCQGRSGQAFKKCLRQAGTPPISSIN